MYDKKSKVTRYKLALLIVPWKRWVMCLITELRFLYCLRAKIRAFFLNYRNAFVLYDDCPLSLNKSLACLSL